MSKARRVAWPLVFGAALALVLGMTQVHTRALRSVLEALVVVLALGASLLGPWLHRPVERRPWRLLSVAVTLFALGLAVRPARFTWPDPQAIASDLFVLGGYTVTWTLLSMMAHGEGRRTVAVTWDGLLVTLGTAAVSSVLFIVPALAQPGRSAMTILDASAFPVLDMIFFYLVVRLGFTQAARLPSYWALVGCAVALLGGDAWYAWFVTHGAAGGVPVVVDVVYTLGYALLCVIPLHPSMTGMVATTGGAVEDWSRRRLAVLAPAVLAPAVLFVVEPHPTSVARWVLGLTSGGIAGILLLRSARAVRGLAGAHRVLSHQALHDPLTELPNRRQLIARIQDLLTTEDIGTQPLWLIYLNLDRFRCVNDAWGHQLGDRVIQQVASVLESALPDDALLAHSGGDEFSVLLHAERREAESVARVLCERMRQPIEVDGLDVVVTASLGLASASSRGVAIDLIRDADTAMGRAKSAGRDQWVTFGAEMRERVRDRFEIELALRHAQERDQLWVAYQPIVDLHSEKANGCEALLRWRHDTQGPIPPNLFIPVAEESGLIVDIGTWVLGTAARQVARWRFEHTVPADFVLSVNVSARQLDDGALPETVAAVLHESELPPANLCLELTETAMLDRLDRMIEVLREIRELGVAVSVDDFGTGYSSLSYLSQLPVSNVKIDRCFVERLDQETPDDAIVRAVKALSSALRLGVVAEGVETEAQRDTLRALGIERGQGWLWGAAVPGSEFCERFGVVGRSRVGTSRARDAGPSELATASGRADGGSSPRTGEAAALVGVPRPRGTTPAPVDMR